jgi:hypothetical protein
MRLQTSDGVYYNGERVGCYATTGGGKKAFVNFTTRLREEEGYAITREILDELDDDVELFIFRDTNNKHLYVYSREDFLERGRVLGPGRYDDQEQVVSEDWRATVHPPGECNINGGKYDELSFKSYE